MKKLSHNTTFKPSDLFVVEHNAGRKSKFTGCTVGYLSAEHAKRHSGNMISVRILNGEHKDKIAEIRAENLVSISLSKPNTSNMALYTGNFKNSYAVYYPKANRYLVTNSNGSQRFVKADDWVHEYESSLVKDFENNSIISKIRKAFKM